MNRTVILEKETFRTDGYVSDQEDLKFIIKATVNYERLTYKVTPVMTTSHEIDDDFIDALSDGVTQATEECQKRLASHRNAHGIGQQTELDFNAPAAN
jgi:hypothetical protein